MAWIGLWPLVGPPQGDSSSITGEISAGASVSAEDASDYPPAGFLFSPWRVLGLVTGMGMFDGASYSRAQVTGAPDTRTVQTSASTGGALVTGVNVSSIAGGDGGFVGLFPFVGAVQGSTAVLPWMAGWSQAQVTGEGVYSVLGDYATPSRSVFDLPPPYDFKPPGLTLDYGLPTSLRAAGAVQGDATAYSSATGQLALAIVKAAEAAAASAATGQLRAVVVNAGEIAAGARVTGVAVGRVITVETGASASASTATAVDRSLAPGVGLGIAGAYSASAGEGLAENAQLGAASSSASTSGVDASGYPLAAPRASSGSYASVSGEAVAIIVKTAQAEANAVIAAVQATLVIAEAAAYAHAMVTANGGVLVTTAPGGRWPRSPRGSGRTRTVSTTRSRPVNS